MNKADKYKLHKIMKSYRMNAALISELRKWGLAVEKTKNHVKIMRMDGVGRTIDIPSTPSDYRDGDNAATRIIRLLDYRAA